MLDPNAFVFIPGAIRETLPVTLSQQFSRHHELNQCGSTSCIHPSLGSAVLFGGKSDPHLRYPLLVTFAQKTISRN